MQHTWRSNLQEGKKQPQNVVYDNCLRMAMMRKVIEKPPPKEGIPCQVMESSQLGFRVMRIPVVHTGFVLALKIQEKQKCCQKQGYHIKYCLRRNKSFGPIFGWCWLMKCCNYPKLIIADLSHKRPWPWRTKWRKGKGGGAKSGVSESKWPLDLAIYYILSAFSWPTGRCWVINWIDW